MIGPKTLTRGLAAIAALLLVAACSTGAPDREPGARERPESHGSLSSGGTNAQPVAARYVPKGWPGTADTGATGPWRRMAGRTITRDGTVIANREIIGTLTIRADDVTLRNVVVRANSYYGILTYGRNTVIKDSTVAGTNPDTMAGIAAIEGGTVRAYRIEVRGVEDGVRLSDDSVLRDSLIHRLSGDPDSHYDGVTADSGNTGWQIVHNTILNHHGQTGAVWVGDERYGRSSGVLRENYLAGGGYTVYAGPGTGRGIRVVDNVFSTRFFPRSGRWGVSCRWEPDGNTWRGNKWIDGPRRGHYVRP